MAAVPQHASVSLPSLLCSSRSNRAAAVFSSSLRTTPSASPAPPKLSFSAAFFTARRCSSPLVLRPTPIVARSGSGEVGAVGAPEAGDVEEMVPRDFEVEVADGEDEPVASDANEPGIRPPRKPKFGEIIGILNRRAIEAREEVRPVPELRSGDIVEIKLAMPQLKRRLTLYKGIIISKQNSGIHTTIRIRRIIAGVGVEIVFPVYSPNVKEIKVVSHRKVRRAKLYYLRDKVPRLSTFK